jgi:glycosyltransferase involved in cell wall biosynthesis
MPRMSRARLLFVVESGTDVRLVEGLAQHFDLSMIARKIEGGAEISWPPNTTVETTVGPPGRAAFARFVFRQLLHRRSQTDIILVQGYSVAALAANTVHRLTSIPVLMLVCSPVEAYYRCRLTHPNGRPYHRHEAVLLDLVARTNALVGFQHVVLSRYLEDVVRGHGARRVHNIPIYGVDTQRFKPAQESRATLKHRLNLPVDGTLIFFSSRIAPEKDSETLLRAMRRLLDSGHNLWLLHRSGGYRQFKQDAQRFGILNRVIASDAVHPHRELPRDYQACDICVQASREEGLGFSPLEALASGTPVVATKVGGLRETITDGETGWTYPVGNDEQLAACMLNVIQDHPEAIRRTNNGRRLVCEKFERSLVFEKFAVLVSELTQQKTSGANA